jgi:hypothetical protein
MATLNQSEPWLCIGHYSIMQKSLTFAVQISSCSTTSYSRYSSVVSSTQIATPERSKLAPSRYHWEIAPAVNSVSKDSESRRIVVT